MTDRKIQNACTTMLFSAVIVAVVLGGPSGAFADGQRVERIFGNASFETMEQIVSSGWAGSSCDIAVIVKNTDWHDVVSASALAGAFKAPVVMVNQHPGEEGLGDNAVNALRAAGTRRAIVVGGPGSVDETVDKALEEIGIDVIERIYGEDNATTSVAVAQKVNSLPITTKDKVCFLSTESSYPDAISASPYAYAFASPIILTEATGELAPGTADAIRASGTKKVIITGGPSAIADEVVDGLQQELGEDYTLWRLFGEVSYDTSCAVASWTRWGFSDVPRDLPAFSAGKGLRTSDVNTDRVGFSSAKSWKDGSIGAVFCGKNNIALVVTDDGEGGQQSALADFFSGIYLEAVAADSYRQDSSNNPSNAIIFGGESILGTETEERVAAYVEEAYSARVKSG